MVVRIITVHVKKDAIGEFEARTKENHHASLQEPGVLRFDVLKDTDRPGTYFLYEVYRSDEATKAHKETAHYHAWKDGVADLLVGDRTSVTCIPVAPTDEERW